MDPAAAVAAKKDEWSENAVSTADLAVQFDERVGRPRNRTPAVHRLARHDEDSLFSFGDKVAPEVALPPVFRTVSHSVDGYVGEKGSAADTFAGVDYHTTDPDVLARRLGTSLSSGLAPADYAAKQREHGANVQLRPPSRLAQKLLMYFFGGFGLLLLAGGILCVVCWKPLGEPDPAVANLVLGVILLVVFVMQALFNFFQDISSSRVMDSIHDMIPSVTMVTRAAVVDQVDAKTLVPGDVVSFVAGEKVPADLRIFDASPDLAFDRAILTGESNAIAATSRADASSSNYLQSTCIAMQGTFIVSGCGRGLVVATGDHTIFGTIARLTSQPKKGLSPMQSEVLRFVLTISAVIVVLAVLIVILWAAWLRKDHPDWISVPVLIVDIVSVAVAFIPEGLPIALTTCLIITAYQMKKNKILCKTLSAVETLGSVSVLCFDKTGTLTKNAMTVTNSCLGGAFAQTADDETLLLHTVANPITRHFLTVAAMCNDAIESALEKLNGNATDKAVYKYALAFQSREVTAEPWTTKFTLAFNSKDKYMARLLEPKSSEQRERQQTLAKIGVLLPSACTSNFMLLTVKGAPDILLKSCQFILKPTANGADEEVLDGAMRLKLADLQQTWARQGKRVILMASKLVSAKLLDTTDTFETTRTLRYQVSDGLTFVGMVAIEDPPRKQVDRVICKLRDAGIKIVMITGDFELTGLSIAKQVGIVTENVDDYNDVVKDEHPERDQEGQIDRAVSLTGPDLGKLTEEQWERVVHYKELVFARTTPEQKLLIIKQFQKHKQIVGMTGDGINDSPSLKLADIGISLIDASDIAKEASDLILMNNLDLESALFDSIVEALKFGRLVFENLKKTIGYLLPAGTYSELWPVLLNVIFGMPQMLSSFLMIIICCVTDCANAITLAYEGSERNLLTKKPRSVTREKLVDWRLVLHSYITLGTFYSFTSFLLGFLNLKRKGYGFADFRLSYGAYADLPGVNDAINMSSSIYFNNLVIMQFFNLMAMRVRYLSMFQHSPLRNRYIFVLIPFAFACTFIVNYIPAIQNAMGTAQVPVEYYFISLGFGAVVLAYDEVRKWWVRAHPHGPMARIAW